MSSYENVVGGKLKLKGKALDVKAAGLKKKKKNKKHHEELSHAMENDLSTDGKLSAADHVEDTDETNKDEGKEQAAFCEDQLTPAERRYIEQKERIDVHRLAKIANKSHRDRIQDFNQYLANLSEHYDIPKVGPG